MEKKIFVCVIGGMLLAVGVFSLFHAGNTRPLSGVYEEYEAPELTVSSYMDGSYQESMDRYVSANYAWHNLNIRAYNQMRYSAFGLSNSVVVGRDGVLYEEAYIRESFGLDAEKILSDEEIGALAEKISLIQEEARAQGRAFVFVFTPSKADDDPEHIPSRYKYMDSYFTSEKTRNYKRLEQAFDELGVVYVDSYDALAEADLKTPLFYDGGIHWSRVSADIVFNAAIDQMNTEYGLHVAKVNVTDVQSVVTTEDEQDWDLYRLLNLWYAKRDSVYYVPVEEVKHPSPSESLSLFVQGGSFSNKFMRIASENEMFKEAYQEFYAQSLQDYNRGISYAGGADQPEFREAVSQADLIMLESNVENVSGLMPEMYDEIYRILLEDEKHGL